VEVTVRAVPVLALATVGTVNIRALPIPGNDFSGTFKVPIILIILSSEAVSTNLRRKSIDGWQVGIELGYLHSHYLNT
jgi:hypothetical protein